MYRPERILLAGFAAYLVIWIVAPLQPLVEIEPGSILFVGLCSLSFLVGSQLDDFIALSRPVRYASLAVIRRMELSLFTMTFLIGVFGNLFRFYDRYIARGVGFTTGLDAREALIDYGASSLSIVGAALYPFGYLPIFIYLGTKVLPKNRLRFWAALVLFLLPALDGLVLYSRSFMLVSLAMIYFGISIAVYHGRMLPLRLILPFMAAFALVLALSVIIFAWRLSEMELSVIESSFLSAYAYTVAPNELATRILRSNGPAAVLLSSLLPLSQYFTHSLFELQILWKNAATQVHSYGALHFLPYVKVLSIFGFATLPDLDGLFPRVGVFTSFFGPLWVDFGWFGVIMMLVFGILARHLGRMARAGNLSAIPLYTYICVILFFAPVVNFFISAQGGYTMNAFLIFFLLSRKKAQLSAE